MEHMDHIHGLSDSQAVSSCHDAALATRKAEATATTTTTTTTATATTRQGKARHGKATRQAASSSSGWEHTGAAWRGERGDKAAGGAGAGQRPFEGAIRQRICWHSAQRLTFPDTCWGGAPSSPRKANGSAQDK